MTPIRFTLLVALSVATLTGCGGSDSRPPVADSTSVDLAGHLLFSRFDEASHSFVSTHTIRPDGKGEVEVPMPGPEGGGEWSRSGEHIAVMTELDDRIGTAIITAEGKVERELELQDPTLNLVCTVWSTDDSRLACEGWDETDETRQGIYTVRASDGGDLVRLTTTPQGVVDLPGDFSPDGKALLFKRGQDEAGGQLMMVDVIGGEPRPLGKESVEDPGRFSPDGKTILTAAEGHLLLLDATGTPHDEITDEGADLFGAVWSPDGSHIAYSRSVSGPFADIYISLPDGSDRHKVTSTPDNEIRVEWGAK